MTETHKHYVEMEILLSETSDLITTLTYLKNNHATLKGGKWTGNGTSGYVRVQFEEVTRKLAEAKELVLRAQFFGFTRNEVIRSPRIPPADVLEAP